MDDIPVKLRCAACNKLAVNAFRTPCCDQSVCESCQSTLPQACPICLHEPVKAEDCRPNKTLRMTIKAFLRKIMTERDKTQKKQTVDKASAVPPTGQVSETGGRPSSTVPDATSATQPSHVSNVTASPSEVSSIPHSADHPKPLEEGKSLPTEAQKDVPQPSIEATDDQVREESFQEQARAEGAALNQTTSQQDGSQPPQNQQSVQMQGTDAQWPAGQTAGQGMNGGSYGFEGMSNGFPNMAFNNPGDFNSMMQFIPNNAMGAFPNMMG
ncbi:MAG: hypothetical protein Q9179_006257 [Wetmoreana sp. 5 TL-2023]